MALLLKIDVAVRAIGQPEEFEVGKCSPCGIITAFPAE
jgi:hypothetical protein